MTCMGCGRTTHVDLPQFGVILDEDGYCSLCRPYGLFIAETAMNPSVGQMWYRAFCRCGWYGQPTDSSATARAGHAEHAGQHA